ncbi:MAG: flagellar basal-body rod protein FlgG [Chloroflexota bacterium]|nr:flagellar basal-body rod protein FlgG [Chloroflexota bacterium]
MWTAIRVATAGVHAQQAVMDVAANNLANLQTTGFKAKRADLTDLPPGVSTFSALLPGGGLTLVTDNVGQGADVGAVRTSLAQGAFQETGHPLDVAINGDGLIPVQLPSGQLAYTRAGSLLVDAQGRLVTGNGYPVAPNITVPAGASNLRIEHDGTIVARTGSATAQPLGRLQLARFDNAEALTSIGANLFTSTAASGDPVVGNPASAGFGTLERGSLESSNVDAAAEFLRIMSAQRAYQANLTSIRTIDQMLQEANNLKP